MIGELIGQYRIVQAIGQGGMSTVYKATQPTFERDVAIKILPRQFSEDPTFLKRFQREARVIARLEHRSILPVYDYGEHDGVPYIVMRLMEAGTLRRKLFYEGVTVQDAVRIIEEVAEALDYAHAHNVIHRDLKPSNILLDENGDAYLTDFGIAKMLGSTSQVTGSGVVGTPNYMSPEQCQGKPLAATSDIYALGTILFEILTGTPPYEAELPLTVMYMHVRDPIPSAYERNPALPPEIDAVIQRALAKRANDRYQTARELAANFRRVVERISVGASPPPPRPPATAPLTHDDEPDDSDLYEGYAGAPEVIESVVSGEYGYLSNNGYTQTGIPSRTSRGTTLLTVVGGILILALMLGAAGFGLSAMSGSHSGGLFPTLPPTRTPGIPPSDEPTTEIALLSSQTPITPGSIIIPTDIPSNTPVSLPSNTTVPPSAVPMILATAPPTYTPTITPSSTITLTPSDTPTFTPTATDTPLPTGGAGDLAYTEGSGNTAEIAIVDANGQNHRVLTSNSYYDGEPDFSSDGNQIAFESLPGLNRDIYIMASNGSNVRQLTNSPDDDRNPDWAPDDSMIVYESGKDAQSEIYVINADGTGNTRLTNNGFDDRAPTFSPDGSKIAYMTKQRGKWEIAVMAYPSGNQLKIYDCPAPDCRFPNWARDGLWIVYNTLDSSGNAAEIWEINFSNSTTSVLVSGTDKGRPSYSGDEVFCFFNSTSPEGNLDLYRINVITLVIERLTVGPANKYAPDWGP